LIIKSQESPWFLACRWCATYHWKALDENYNFVLDLIFIGGLHTKLWASKVTRDSISRILRLPFKSPEIEWQLGASPMAKHIIYYKGEGGGYPLNPGCVESCESVFACGLSMHQKCSNYALTNLLFGLCKFMWIIELLVILPNPHPGAPAHPSTFKVLRARERAPTPYPSIVFTFILVVESTKEFGGASKLVQHFWV
jgi:hypothetical protein